MVARPLIAAPTYTFFVIGTDGTDTSEIVQSRFAHVQKEFELKGVKVLSFGADGAGAFLKAMINNSMLFQRCSTSNIPESWSFYFMARLFESGLNAQDLVHLLAKFRTRLLLPSNIIVLGNHPACSAHLNFVQSNYPKERHGLSLRALDVRDKQNYSSIGIILSDAVFQCLQEVDGTLDVKGTIVYMNLMKDIRDAFLNKEISPSQRILLAWRSVFFLRIWRVWLKENGIDEKDHFVTNNIYICVELNCHLLLNLVYNVKSGVFPVESLRLWFIGSQACEELYRILRAMTPMFSTILNFSVKGVLQRIHNKNHLSTLESSEELSFPRAKRRLLQYKEESPCTFAVDDLDILEWVCKAKQEAINTANKLGMTLPSYDDAKLILNSIVTLDDTVSNDGEDDTHEDDEESDENSMEKTTIECNKNDIITINEDLIALTIIDGPSEVGCLGPIIGQTSGLS